MTYAKSAGSSTKRFGGVATKPCDAGRSNQASLLRCDVYNHSRLCHNKRQGHIQLQISIARQVPASASFRLRLNVKYAQGSQISHEQ